MVEIQSALHYTIGSKCTVRPESQQLQGARSDLALYTLKAIYKSFLVFSKKHSIKWTVYNTTQMYDERAGSGKQNLSYALEASLTFFTLSCQQARLLQNLKVVNQPKFFLECSAKKSKTQLGKVLIENRMCKRTFFRTYRPALAFAINNRHLSTEYLKRRYFLIIIRNTSSVAACKALNHFRVLFTICEPFRFLYSSNREVNDLSLSSSMNNLVKTLFIFPS